MVRSRIVHCVNSTVPGESRCDSFELWRNRSPTNGLLKGLQRLIVTNPTTFPYPACCKYQDIDKHESSLAEVKFLQGGRSTMHSIDRSAVRISTCTVVKV